MSTNIPKIKLAVTHYGYWSKTNGNSTWFHRITSTLTGKSIIVSSPHESNMRSILLSAGFEFSDMLESQQDISFAKCKQLEKEKDTYSICVEMPEELGTFLTDNVFKYL